VTLCTRRWRCIVIIASLFASLIFWPSARLSAGTGRVLTVCARGCAYTSINAALGLAQAGDTIQVGPGSYLEHVMMRPGVTISGAGNSVSIITGGGDDTVVRAYGAGIGRDAVLEGFTIKEGKSFTGGGIDIRGGASPTIRNNLITENAAGSGESYGGGMFISGGSPLISGNVFTKNSASWGGGAIAIWDGSTAVITGNYIEGNKSDQYGGGINVTRSSPSITSNTIVSNKAVYGGGVDMSDSSPEFANNLIQRNEGSMNGGGVHLRTGSAPTIFANTFLTNISGYYGGGLYMVGRSTPSVTGNSFQYNDADSGGAIFMENSSPLIARNLVANNTVAFHGGGIHIHNGSPTVDNNNIINNSATIAGGGLGMSGHSWPIVTNNTLANNAVGLFGGGVYIEGAAPNLINNMIMRNSSGGQGGGLYVQNATPLIQNNTIAYNNLAGNGEGIYLTGHTYPTITNNIIAGNGYGIVSATTPGDETGEPVIMRNDVWNNRAGDFIGIAAGQNISVDPLFVSGREGPFYLSQVSAGQSENSPAIDAGTAPASDLGLDQRTTAVHDVPDEGTVDMGFHYRALFYKAYLPITIGERP
jgi:parallel beta-helix repeat protein